MVMSRIDGQLLVPLNANTMSEGALAVQGEHDDGVARIACANAARASVLAASHFDAFSDPTLRCRKSAVCRTGATRTPQAGLPRHGYLRRARLILRLFVLFEEVANCHQRTGAR